MMNQSQSERYSRQILLKQVGEEGQEKLLNSRVLIVGAGGLGSPAALYLASAGVGHIGILDDDIVDLTNLQRQIIHSSEFIGTPKVRSAKKRIEALNPDIKVSALRERLEKDNVKDIFNNYDFILDATDNFQTKFLINDTCVLLRKPFSYGGIQEFGGQLMTYVPGEGPCYRCIFEEPPEDGVIPTCREVGVIGCMAGIIGTLQSMEAVKYLLGIGELLTGRLLTVDALTMEFRQVRFPKKNPECLVCGRP
ncbi:MAG: HesA/MoeB/ThiF family protein [Eubacterium sp.]|nr:HesA/MoeB/ThiF family protein [Eubacterium sp.]